MLWSLVWGAVLLITIVLEAVTRKLICAMLIPASVIATVLSLLDIPPYWQAIAFSLAALGGLTIGYLFIFKTRSNIASNNDLDSIVGEKCVVIEKIDTFAGCGHARVRGQVWSARGLDQDDVFESGETLKIVGVEGVRLICRKK